MKTVTMYVMPGTQIPANPPDARLVQDPMHPTPPLVAVTVIGNAANDHGTYYSTCTAICFITLGQYEALRALLGDTTHQVEVDITYDNNSGPGPNYPIVGGPVFSPIDPLTAPAPQKRV